jgi:hypothetical protein
LCSKFNLKQMYACAVILYIPAFLETIFTNIHAWTDITVAKTCVKLYINVKKLLYNDKKNYM